MKSLESDIRFLLETLKLIYAATDPEQMLTLILQKMTSLTGADQGCVLVGETLDYRLGLSRDGQRLSQEELPRSSTVIDQAITTRRPVISLDTATGAFKNTDSIVRHAQRMVLDVPMVNNNELFGVLYLTGQSAGDEQSEHRQDIFMALADQATIAVRKAAMVARLRQLDAAKTDFIQIVAHEMRTPLAIVAGYADMLSTMALSDEAAMMVRQLTNGAARLASVVNQMIIASQISQQTLRLDKKQFSMRALIRIVVSHWKNEADQRQLALNVNIIDPADYVCQIDSHYLEIALSHLVQNAIKFTPDGGAIVIEMSATRDNQIRVLIADTGIGIDRQYLELIFEKFYRTGNILSHSSGNAKFMGAGPGLGLYLARHIVMSHGGRLWAESDGAGRGSRFLMLLPI